MPGKMEPNLQSRLLTLPLFFAKKEVFLSLILQTYILIVPFVTPIFHHHVT
jgi:hypothetical protein